MRRRAKRRTEEGEVEGKREEKGRRAAWRFAANAGDTVTGARGVRASHGICLAYVENLVQSPGIVMGAFRLLVCNIRNSCLPVCRLLPVRDVPIGAGEARTVRLESGITCVGRVAEGRMKGRRRRRQRRMRRWRRSTRMNERTFAGGVELFGATKIRRDRESDADFATRDATGRNVTHDILLSSPLPAPFCLSRFFGGW